MASKDTRAAPLRRHTERCARVRPQRTHYTLVASAAAALPVGSAGGGDAFLGDGLRLSAADFSAGRAGEGERRRSGERRSRSSRGGGLAEGVSVANTIGMHTNTHTHEDRSKMDARALAADGRAGAGAGAAARRRARRAPPGRGAASVAAVAVIATIAATTWAESVHRVASAQRKIAE